MWESSEKIKFKCKADAFNYFNLLIVSIDNIYLWCNNELRYCKSQLGIFDYHLNCYVIGLLPVEYYN